MLKKGLSHKCLKLFVLEMRKLIVINKKAEFNITLM